MSTPIWSATVSQGGKLEIQDRAGFLRYAAGFRDQPVEIIIRKPRRQRSNQQNRYYWGVVVALVAEHLGYEPDECHEAIAWHLLKIPAEPGKLPRRRSTAEMSTADFQEYVERVRRWAAQELGVVIPDPNTVEC